MGCGGSKHADNDNVETRAPHPTSNGGAGGMEMGSHQQQQTQMSGENPIVYFDMTQAGKPIGRIVFELRQDIVPNTSENFRRLCLGDFQDSKGKIRTYKGSAFHRCIPDFMLQGGDITNGDGTGKFSIYNKGKSFEDENFELRHDVPGLLSMANSGPNTNGSQFFITTVPTPHLDGKHVVFGRVIEGMDVVKRIEGTRIGELDRPVQEVEVAGCGQLN